MARRHANPYGRVVNFRFLGVTTAALALCAASTADAAPWARVTARGGVSIDQVSPLRTGDGVLHVAWRHPAGSNSDDLLHTTITPDGKVGATVPIVSGWVGVLDPALT